MRNVAKSINIRENRYTIFVYRYTIFVFTDFPTATYEFELLQKQISLLYASITTPTLTEPPNL